MNPRWFSTVKLVRSIVTMVIIAGLSIFVYDYIQTANGRNARDEAALIREQTQVLQTQAQELNQQLRSAKEAAAVLKSEVAGQRREVEQDKAQQLVAGYLAEGLQIAAAARVAIAESYQTTLQLPDSNQAAGIAGPAQFKGASLQRMQVGDQGRITLLYDAKSGVDGGRIELIPTPNGATGAITWACRTASFPEIAVSIPQCVYENPGASATASPR